MQGGNPNDSAPGLGGIINRPTGATGFRYSKALKGAGFNWSEKHLFMYLKNPAKYVTGNKMSFAGLESEKDRSDIIAYLKTI